jgi:hypothetical protein
MSAVDEKTMDEYDQALYEAAWTWKELRRALGASGEWEPAIECQCTGCGEALTLLLCSSQPLLLLVCHRCELYFNRFRLERGADESGAPS